MGWRDRIAGLISGDSQRFNLGQYPQFLADYASQFGYAGSLYPLGLNQSALSWSKTEEISATLPNYVTALRRSPPAFAAQLVRASVLSMARFTFRGRPNTSTPRRQFGTDALLPLEKPFTNMSTGELISRMEWSAGLAGNAYVLRQPNVQRTSASDSPYRLRVLRPDWTAIVYGSNAEPDDPKGALDAEIVGYAYRNGGFTQQNKAEIQVLLPEQVAHWSPLIDPLSPGLGMSWITPALRDIQADGAALEHKLAYFSNGATPNLVIKGIPSTSTAAFKEWVDQMENSHKGSTNAFKTLYLTAGADATVVGSNLADLDITSITAHGETRVSYLSRVPAVILGIAAGLKGSSLNAGNYGEARRNFADSWVYPQLASLCSSISTLITVPGGAELWFDVADVPLLREDALDAANIEKVKEETIVAYVNGGFTPESAIIAVRGQDISQLKHSGLVSVQLQPPGSQQIGPAKPVVDETKPASNGQVKASQDREEFLLRAWRESAPPPVVFQPGAITSNVTVERDTTAPAPPPTVEIHNEYTMPPVTVEQAAVTVQPAEVTVNNTFEPPAITLPPTEINVQPAAVTVQPANVTVEPAQVTVESPAITVQPAAVTVQPPSVHVHNNVPATPPSAGVVVDYDSEGKVIGTRPRNRPKGGK